MASSQLPAADAALHDAHCHLSFMSEPGQVAHEAEAAGALLFANTVVPAEYAEARRLFADYPNVCVGLGLHPWWVGENAPVDEFLAHVGKTRFIGEVGLDFGTRHIATAHTQKAVFHAIAKECARQGGKIISLHSVKAAHDVLDELVFGGALDSCTCIFHWFTGPSDQLKRAIDAGCLFSVGARMVATGKGREYVKAIPVRQLLLETDLPAQRGDACTYAQLHAALEEAARVVAEIKGPDALAAIDATSRAVLGPVKLPAAGGA